MPQCYILLVLINGNEVTHETIFAKQLLKLLH